MLDRLGHAEMIRKMMPGYRQSRDTWKFILFLFSYLFLILALADPQIGTRMEEVKREGVDIFVAIDVSLSMQAEDIAPNRLEKAKFEVGKLIDLLQGDRIGLIAFSGIAHVQCPLTLDYSAAKLFLKMMDTHLIPLPGTAVGEAIDRAVQSFNQQERKHKVLILITDGEDHETDPIEAAEKAGKEGVLIYTIGLGSSQGVPIPLYDRFGRQTGFKKDNQGNVVTTRLDMETLEKIAFLTGGKYHQASNGETELKAIYDEVSALEKKELVSRQFAQYEDRFQSLLVAAILMMIVGMLIPVRNKK